ncbi:MAG TPA: glycosyltransferase family 4 protein [Terracidiphilus sp.]|nr:glycosyltransferase family 4 protein [Terracidiphilus sp.]
MARIGIVSLRFNPAFVQHQIAFIKLIKEMGHEPVCILDGSYEKFPEIRELSSVINPRCDLGSLNLTHAIFLNASPVNRKAASAMKENGAKIFYVLHEPRQPVLKFLWAEGPRVGVKGLLAHCTSVPLIKLADVVLLASHFAISAYDGSDRKHNENRAYFPLIFDDESQPDITSLLPAKRYLGFIGGLCRAHGFDRFFQFMREELQKGSDLKFLIASRHPLPAEIRNDDIVRNNKNKLSLRCGRPLSNSEMNRAYAECFCIWNVYRRSTQSGVLPKAFMFGTPVLASTVGSFPEFVEDGSNGRFVKGQGHQGIAEALREMRTNLGRYATSCRKTFREQFFYQSSLKRFEDLL